MKQENTSLEIFYEKVAEGRMLASDGPEIQGKIRLAVQVPFIGRDHSIYSFQVTHAKLVGKSQLSFLVSAEVAPYPKSYEDVLQCTAENAMKDFAQGGVWN
jgi:hypothetical protein